MEYKVFGCKTNKYFTDKWAESSFLADKTGVFVSSCVVTDKAKTKWVRFVRQKLRSLKEGEKIYISGCGSIKNGEIDQDFYSTYPELVPFKDQLVLLAEEPEETTIMVDDLKSRIQKVKSLRASELHTKKFIVIQTGCDNFCTFCLTVQARGRHKSRDAEDIIGEIQSFVSSWGQEAVITGTNLGAWGAESSNNFSESKFVELVKRILQETDIPRLRISSLWVEFLSDDLIELFKEPRINPYVHLSIQSGSDAILKSMNRHYDRTKLISVLEQIRSIERDDGILVNIWADLIVGFPGESEEDFQDTLDIVGSYGITQLHAFPFSPHKDHYSVPAGSFPHQVPENIKNDRWKRLMDAGVKAKESFLTMNTWKRMHVLVERLEWDMFQGWSENYIELMNTNFSLLSNQIIERGKVYEGVLSPNVWLMSHFLLK